MSTKTFESLLPKIEIGDGIKRGRTVGENMETTVAASVTLDEILLKLDTSLENGLTNVEVDRRRQLHPGYNEMNIKEDEPLWKKYIGQV